MQNKITLLFISFWFIACNPLLTFEEEGEFIVTKIEFEKINHIETNNIFNLIIIQDETEFILFKGGEKKIATASAHITEQKLTIDHDYKNNFRNFENIVAEIHLKNLDKITINTPINLSSLGTIKGNKLAIDISPQSELVELNVKLDYKELDLHVYGSSVSGKYQLAGVCGSANYTMNGTTNIHSLLFECDNISLAQNGIGEAHVWAKSKLNVTIYNTGNIYYKDSPKITINRVQINNQNPTAKVLPE